MAEPLAPNALVTVEELTLSNMWEISALVEGLERPPQKQMAITRHHGSVWNAKRPNSFDIDETGGPSDPKISAQGRHEHRPFR